MSVSSHRISAAAARSAVRSSCLAPSNCVWRVERSTNARNVRGRSSPRRRPSPRGPSPIAR
eukprot:6197792-Pleurochrysis_carterae.AAC.1